MFYSHEILTSREGGLATVWLLATLGSKSVSKKVNKKAIQDVNVPKTCDIIIHPEAPMALRLQSNLLYGVSRVFSQQSGFVLSDAQLMQTNMRALLKAVRTSNLDPEAGKARRDQITIEDDSAFIPDLTFDIDLHALEISTTESSRRSSLLSPHTARSSLSSHPDGSMTGLIIPSSSGGGGDIGGFQLPSEQGSSIQRQQRINRLLEDDGEGFDIDPGFSIDADGNVLVEGPAAADEGLPGARVRTPDDRGNLPPSSEVRAGTQGAQYDPGLMDFAFDDQVQFQDENAGLPEAEPFPTGAQQQISSFQAAEDEESESAEAAMHRRHRPARKARALPFDNVQELRTAELTGWRENYTTNMAEVQQSRDQHRAPFLAKKKAFDWVLGSGIGGVGDAFPSLHENNPLNMFTGDSMLEMITGIRPSAGRKRGRDEESADATDSETRRKRLQEEEGGEIGRGEIPPFQDDDMGFQASDDIEIGRHGATPLADDPTFPWNTTASALASRQGSSIAHRGSDQPLGFPSSVAAGGRSAPPSILRLGSLDRRASRVASSSPLRGRGGDDIVHPGSVSPAHLPSEEPSYQGFGNDDDDIYDSFGVHGPAAGVGTQVQASSQWLRATMNQEAVNFFDFVRETIEALPPPSPVAGDEEGRAKMMRRVEFEQLLPPREHSTVIAAQGLHHVLALATKNLLEVEQREAFGGIRIGIRA